MCTSRMMEQKVIYTQLLSSVNPSFWNKITELKLNVDKLTENERYIWGYSHLLGSSISFQILEVDSTSFNESFGGHNMYLPFQGKILNKNTIESFKNCDKMELINNEGAILYSKILSGEALKTPSVLNCFFVLSFADLKKYHYYYWFAFPVPSGITLEKESSNIICDEFSSDMLEDFCKKFQVLDNLQKTFFIMESKNNELLLHTLESKMKFLNTNNMKNFYFVFYNVSTDQDYFGSQLRNYIYLILHYCQFLAGSSQKFVSFRLTRCGPKIVCKDSLILRLKLPSGTDTSLRNWVGWEKNERDKMGPRLANMKNTLDPAVLAENSVDLNLKLMKWRILPDIDLEKIKTIKCLLLGAGTLGCSVARNLMGWGVRNITFVDNSTVSFSNPVRQNLFSYKDSVDMRPKALAAAESLKTIFPGINSSGIQINIPMPGHSIGESMLEQTKISIETLFDAIKEHDFIFLLTDSRESRWLPTVLGMFLEKVVINAALGFDSYLVMRHGFKTRSFSESDTFSVTQNGYKVIRGSNLGCYFCNDVRAPGNSTQDRTLDQQCTVTRPGVSYIASALAVELAISILQHKDGADAPAFYRVNNDLEDDQFHSDIKDESLLGLVPHSIRGFLSSFTQMLPATSSYNKCIACSDIILDEYKKDGFEFLLKVFNSSKYLEDVTHLTEMFGDIDFDEVLELSDEEIESDEAT